MNDIAVIENETLEYIPATTMLRLVEKSQKSTKNFNIFQKAIRAEPELFRKLELMDTLVEFYLDNEWMNLSFSGDGKKLGEVWAILRHSGYSAIERPKKGDTAFSAFWSKTGMPAIFMMFSSTLCKRVKTGTKMVEVDTYETQCGELTELPQEVSTSEIEFNHKEPTDTLGDDIPF